MNPYKALLLAGLCLIAPVIGAQDLAPSEPIPQGIERILSNYKSANLQNVNIGIVIQSMQTGKIIYEKNSRRLYSPASVLKLFTAAAALDYLKPSFIYRTQVLTTGKAQNGVLHGDLYVKFSGDPHLKSSNIRQLLHQLTTSGIRQIDGRIYIDNLAYNFIPYPPGWIWDDLSYGYAAPMNAIILNRNMFGLSFEPGLKSGQKPLITADLPPGVIQINNQATTIDKSDAYCPLTVYSDSKNEYTVSGCLEKRWGKQSRALALRDVTPYAKALISKILTEENIAFTGQVNIQKTPDNAYVLSEITSEPLDKIIYHMIKKSDNLATNSVFKKLGETYYQTMGSWQNGLQALKEILAQRTGINFNRNLLADGSGLSRYNLITTRQLSRLLYFAYHNPAIHDPFIRSLPIAGKDGTLSGRMLDQGKSGRIRAKTGTMTGVTSLAGYVYTKNNGVVSFVIMVNGFVKSRRPYTHLQDKICEFLVNAKGPTHG